MIERAQLKQIKDHLSHGLPDHDFLIVPNEYATPSKLMLRTSLSENAIFDLFSGKKLWWVALAEVEDGSVGRLEGRRPYSLGISDSSLAMNVAPRVIDEILAVTEMLGSNLSVPDTNEQFGSIVEAANEMLTLFGIPVMMHYGASATSNMPKERTLVEADGLDDFVLLMRDGRWWGGDEDAPASEQFDTGIRHLNSPEILAMIVSNQIVFSWVGAIGRGPSEVFRQLRILERFLIPIGGLFAALTEHEDEYIATNAVGLALLQQEAIAALSR